MFDLSDLQHRLEDGIARIRIWHRRRNRLGARGERVAVSYLRRSKGLQIVESSARNIYGEIDVIAVDRKSRTVVFVEVKTRQSHDRGHPAEAVTQEKQRRITRIALAFLKHNNVLDSCPVRFDVVAVTWPVGKRNPVIEHYENAFEAVGDYQLFS